MEVLPCENVVPKDAYLEVPGMRDSAGGVDLFDDLLFLVGGVSARVNKMPTFELIFPRNFLEVNYSSLKFDEKTDNFPRKSEIFQLSMIYLR